MIEVNFLDQGTTEELGRIAAQIDNPTAMLKAAGRRGANELKDHFRQRNSRGNKLGGRRTNFWRQVADSVSNPVIEGRTRARISITHPFFLQKYFGGRITPKQRGALTIPVDPLAYGRTVSVFQQTTGIQLFLLRKKGGGLTNLLAGAIGSSAHQFKVYYILSKGVDQDRDPEALPDRTQFGLAILETADDMLQRQIQNKTTPTS